MHFRTTLSALAVACALAAPAHAGLIKMSYTGQVTGYWSLDILQDDFPVGTAVSMTLTYDDSFIGQPISTFYLGMSPSISGTMTLGSSVYTINAMSLSYFSYGPTIDDPSPNYGFHVTGTGPDTDDGEVFSGLGLNFGTGWPGSPTLIGFGNTNWQVANNGYLLIAGTTTHEMISTPVSSPATLALCLAGLGALGLTRPTARRLTA